MRDNKTEIAFLFGAGISSACGMPKTTDLTNSVLIYNETSGIYNDQISACIQFLRRIKVEVDLYYLEILNRLTNYEDLYYVCSQIEDSETFNFDNPVVQSFIQKINNDINPLLECFKNQKIEELTRATRRFVRDNIWYRLRDSNHDSSRIQFLIDTINDKTLNRITIFTMNHDLIIENLFQKNSISYENGFSDEEGDDGYFNTDRFNTTQKRICYAKLHGSINWQRYTHNKIEMFSPEKYDSDYEDNPVFLIGTFNKMFDYTNNDIFFQLYHFFYTKLKIINTLIISGYSFGDKGINTRLHRWMELETENQMIIIDPNCDRLKNSARGIISLNWDGWVEKKKLLPISKGIDSIKWDEVKSLVN